MLLYNSILKINIKYYLPCWELYMDLIETKDNPEDYNFYNWGLINTDINNCFKRNLEDNMDKIIEIVEKQVIDITNNTEGYNIEDGEVILDLGLVNCAECYTLIDIYGYCNCDI
jgi:hypothetical protein